MRMYAGSINVLYYNKSRRQFNRHANIHYVHTYVTNLSEILQGVSTSVIDIVSLRPTFFTSKTKKLNRTTHIQIAS